VIPVGPERAGLERFAVDDGYLSEQGYRGGCRL
jgi:hypothetical protein